jgi:hypothetical protein
MKYPQDREYVYTDFYGTDFSFDDKDQEILDERMKNRELISRPRVGDYVKFSSGEIERLAHDWDEDFQTSPVGSFFLSHSGNAKFSGGLNPAIPTSSMVLTEETLEGEFWFFHHNSTGAGRSIFVKVPCRVYETTAKYEGFITKSVA